jgi:purine-binding chemotaxis protein CheW
MSQAEVEVMDQDTVRRILEERARVLARAPEAEDASEIERLVVLVLGQERYGVDIGHVREIQPVAALTRIPGTPPFWAGLINLRGTVYPVLHLARFLTLPSSAAEGEGKIVLVSTEPGVTIGLLVDDVPAVRDVRYSEIGPPVVGPTTGKTGVVSGLTRDLLSVLDLEVLLADPRLPVDESEQGTA